MALRAQGGSAFLGDTPLVRSVAGGALVSQSLQVDGMLTAFHGALMAFRAGGLRLFFEIVNLVAVIAFKWLMRPRRACRLCQGRFVLVALDAFFIGGHQSTRPEVVAVDARQDFHFREHVCCVGVTVEAGILFWLRLMVLEGMAGGALDIFLEPVQRVPLGPGDLGDFFVALQVAGRAHLAGHDNFIVWPF